MDVAVSSGLITLVEDELPKKGHSAPVGTVGGLASLEKENDAMCQGAQCYWVMFWNSSLFQIVCMCLCFLATVTRRRVIDASLTETANAVMLTSVYVCVWVCGCGCGCVGVCT